MSSSEEKQSRLERWIATERSTDPASPFSETGFHATCDDALAGMDLSSSAVLFTGGYSGIGLPAVRAMAKRGARILLPARRPDAAEEAIAKVREETGNPAIEIFECDLASLKSVRAFAARIIALDIPLRAVICNAGIMATPLRRTAQYFESQFAVNQLAHFLLVNLLVPQLVRGAPSRVVVTSSLAHSISGVVWEDIHYFTQPYNKWQVSPPRHARRGDPAHPPTVPHRLAKPRPPWPAVPSRPGHTPISSSAPPLLCPVCPTLSASRAFAPDRPDLARRRRTDRASRRTSCSRRS